MWFERLFRRKDKAESIEPDLPVLLEVPQQEVTNQLYEMIQGVQRQQPACNYLNRPPKDVAFIVTLQIPPGYRIGIPEDYQLDMVVDTQDLKVTMEEEVKDGMAMVEDENGHFEELKCLVRVLRVDLKGVLVYNGIMGMFEGRKHVTGAQKTYFTSSNSVPIEMVLGYSGAECDQVEHPLKEYAITLIKEDEFMITSEAKCISITQSEEYFYQLNQSLTTRIIHIPYRLTIMPADDPIS